MYRLFKETLLNDQDDENKLNLNINCNNKCQLVSSNNQSLTTLLPTTSSSVSITPNHSK